MYDLIRRSDILESLGDRPENWMDSDEEIQACADWDEFHGIVTRLPAVDAVEVVRCRECKLHDKCSTEDVFKFARLNDDRRFCGVGQRREDGDGDES